MRKQLAQFLFHSWKTAYVCFSFLPLHFWGEEGGCGWRGPTLKPVKKPWSRGRI